MTEQPKPDKFRRYRERKRAAGLREVRLWVPDLSSPEWQEKLAREAASIASMGETADEKAWTDAAEAEMATWDDWKA